MIVYDGNLNPGTVSLPESLHSGLICVVEGCVVGLGWSAFMTSQMLPCRWSVRCVCTFPVLSEGIIPNFPEFFQI